LAADEIDDGIVGGGNDGAIDGIYVFLGDALLAEDSEALQDDFPANKIAVETTLLLYLVQAKRSESFAETAIDLVADSTKRLLDLGESEEDLAALYSSAVLTRIGLFRSALRKFGGRHLQVRIGFYYATRGRTETINAKVQKKANDLAAQFDKVIVKAEGSVEFLGARELWARYSAIPSYTLQLTCDAYSTSGESHVALVTLRDYIAFLQDENGALRRHIFDWNVRDYQGDVEVNKEIRRSLLESDFEFWWLNNGVTIVCSKASITSTTFWLDDVQVVNGLQTSQVIFHALAGGPPDHPALDRRVLVRILMTGDDTKTRDQVIRATNRQTSVPAASLRATDEIQREIEAFFFANDWYYDRRKNYYRNQGKSPARIVGIPLLAQAVMAMGLGEPDNSRARPSTLLKRDNDYKRVFDPNLPLRVYLWLAQAQKAVDAYLLTEAPVTRSERTNFRFHLAMLAVAVLNRGRVYSPSQLDQVVDSGATPDHDLLRRCLLELRKQLRAFMRHTDDSVDKIA
jgi:AIPR protein